jgi:hypothetical protein
MAITPLPDPPSRSDPANFPERADAFMSALPQFATEANTLQEQVDEAAEAVDNDATAAGLSAQAADQSRVQAGTSAGAAAASATQSGVSAGASATSATQAQDWAAKPSGTVAGTSFLSAYQYAQLAAAGAGLPIYAGNAIPTTSQGPIYVVGLGAMEWNGARYQMTQYAHGQCQLRADSGTSLRLYPFNGNGIIINGRQYHIPQAGIAMSNAGLVASSGYAVYLWDDAGTLKLEASATTPAQHSDGVAIKSGDPTRTQVGLIWMDGSIQFRDDTVVRGVASLFNRIRKGMAQIINNASTVSNTSIPMGSSLIAVCFDGMWASLNLAITNSLASTVGNHMSLVVDGTARVALANLITYGATLPINGSLSLSQPLASGLHQVTPYGATNAGTMTWNGYLIAEVIS